MGLRRIEKPQSLRDRAYEEIKQAIISQSLKPGQELREREISELLGISRTPVREARQALEREGWVRTIPWKGVYVCDISPEEIEEVFQLRQANEGLAVELAADRATEAELAHLQVLIKGQVKADDRGDRQTFINLDRDFHVYLAELSGNRRLNYLLSNLSDQMKRLGTQAISMEGRTRTTLAEHERIVAALAKRDAQGARRAMDVHILSTRSAVINSLTKQG